VGLIGTSPPRHGSALHCGGVEREIDRAIYDCDFYLADISIVDIFVCIGAHWMKAGTTEFSRPLGSEYNIWSD
jgi:hypothetical protein